MAFLHSKNETIICEINKMAKKSFSTKTRLDPKVVNGLKMATFGGVCFLDFFYLGTGSAISDTPKIPKMRFAFWEQNAKMQFSQNPPMSRF